MKTLQEVVVENPAITGTPVCKQEIPAAQKTVRADTLISVEERYNVAKRGIIFGVEFEGRTYMVPGHMSVPAKATVPRTAAGALIGVAAVTGG